MNPEIELVERPLVEQLVATGWTHLPGSTSDPAVTERGAFREVLLLERLRGAIRRINVDEDGKPWLDGARISQAVSALEKTTGASLVEINRAVTDLLLGGTTVVAPAEAANERDRTIHYVDWARPANNDFVVVNQFRVDEPGGQAHAFIAPDAVLFVNGIPLVVVEAKAPGPAAAMNTAIEQLRRYANQRGHDLAEGNERLFHTNAFMIATTGRVAKVGTITAQPEHYLEWKDTAPRPLVDVAADLGTTVDELTSQQVLVAGMLSPDRLLDLVRHFTLFTTMSGRTVKLVARYQQYRAVHRTVERLRTGPTREQDGEVDRRGGIVWHTQGSGKSLTMVFLVRRLRSHPRLRRCKVVIVTDRTDLEEQLAATAELTGETVQVARSTDHLQHLLSRDSPDLIMAMIQKYQEADADGGTDPETDFPLLNTDSDILVLVDEAHRSHGSTLHMNLLTALPNAARVGFTGTPIMMGAKKRTHEIFGDYLDTYTLTQSEADGATVPILYEGRTTTGAVRGASTLDELFEDLFVELDDDQRAELQRRWATQGEVAEAPELIADKARNLLRHYVSTVLPGGFKGMVVASSRRACVRYRDALVAARDALVADIEALDPALLALSGDERDELDAETRLLLDAHPRLQLVRALDPVPVFSGDHNDPPDWAEWTTANAQRTHIADFRRPLGTGDGQSPVALLVVKSMLLTGFDAPRAQALYLDRQIRQAELLQAIARVNRTAPNKDHGLVVDYYGVANHLADALAVYTDDDVEGTMRSLASEIDRLPGQARRIRQLFEQRGVTLADHEAGIEEAVSLLADEHLRSQFDVDLEAFLATLDTVMPRPAARPFLADATLFVRIQVAVRSRYRDTADGGFDPYLYREKVRQLVDDHITSLDLSTRIPPVSISDIDFRAHVEALPSARAQASEMEHALRHHIREHHAEDPARYGQLSERLEVLLAEMEDRWDQLVIELGSLAAEARGGYEVGHGLDRLHAPFFGVLRAAHEAHPAGGWNGADPSERIADLAREVVDVLADGVAQVGFSTNPVIQEDVRKDLRRLVADADLFDFETTAQLSTDLLDLGRQHESRLRTQP